MSITQSKKHFVVLDSWRGIGACFVAIMHFMGNSHFRALPPVTSAGFFVDFFFVLSGFVIFANYEDRLKQGFGVVKFMVLRFGRLYPLHFVTLLAFIMVDVIQMIVPALQQYAKSLPFTLPGEQPWDIVSNLFLFHALDMEKIKGFNTPSWSISTEFYTYIIFAIAIVIFRKKIEFFCLIMAALFLSLLIYGDLNDSSYMVIVGFLRCLYGFGIGALCWFFWKKFADKIDQFLVSSHHALWHVIEVLSIVAMYIFIDLAEGVMDHLAALFCAVVLLIFTFEKGIVSTLLKNQFFQLLGLLSYSIYMVHVFIGAKIFPVLAEIIERRFDLELFISVNGRDRLGLELWHGDILTLIYMALVIGVSCISFKLIENPGRRLSRKIVLRKAKIEGYHPKPSDIP